MHKHFREASDMSVILGRSMRHIFRSMDTIITVTITLAKVGKRSFALNRV